MNIENLKGDFESLRAYIYFDQDQYFREQTKSKFHFHKFIQQAEELLVASLTLNDQYCLFSFLGYSYRVLNNPTEGIKYFKKCLTICHHQPRKQIVTMIHLGEAYKYANLQNKALELFDEAMNRSKEYQIEDYEHYIYQHKAKCFLELGNATLAKENLHAALRIREKIENEELICSTRQVLEYINRTR